LPAIRIGHRWYVDRAEVEKLRRTLKSSEPAKPADSPESDSANDKPSD
jgi:hypothetical protein